MLLKPMLLATLARNMLTVSALRSFFTSLCKFGIRYIENSYARPLLTRRLAQRGAAPSDTIPSALALHKRAHWSRQVVSAEYRQNKISNSKSRDDLFR